MRKMGSATDGRVRIRLHEESLERARSFYEAKLRSVSLWVFAPIGDVGFFRRLGRLLGCFAYTPLLLMDMTLAVMFLVVRAAHNTHVKRVA